tara:strand:- start:6870 stop:7187 length:318 start_codon:yes stop_codon:yes gene_type:complete
MKKICKYCKNDCFSEVDYYSPLKTVLKKIPNCKKGKMKLHSSIELTSDVSEGNIILKEIKSLYDIAKIEEPFLKAICYDSLEFYLKDRFEITNCFYLVFNKGYSY